eukprot:7186207-Prorocentrum_lima.AAC.1
MEGALMLIGCQSIARDFGKEFKLRLGSDSSSAKGILSRRGAGRIWHLETPLLWIRQVVQGGGLGSGLRNRIPRSTTLVGW